MVASLQKGPLYCCQHVQVTLHLGVHYCLFDLFLLYSQFLVLRWNPVVLDAASTPHWLPKNRPGVM